MQVSRINMLQSQPTQRQPCPIKGAPHHACSFLFFFAKAIGLRAVRVWISRSRTLANSLLLSVVGPSESASQISRRTKIVWKQPYGSQALKISALFPMHPLPRIVHMSVTSRQTTNMSARPPPPPPGPQPPTPCASLAETDGRQSRMSQLQNAQASQNQAGVQGVKTVPSSLPPSARPMWHSSNLVPNSVHQRHFPQIVFESYAPALVGARYIWLISHNLSQPEM